MLAHTKLNRRCACSLAFVCESVLVCECNATPLVAASFTDFALGVVCGRGGGALDKRHLTVRLSAVRQSVRRSAVCGVAGAAAGFAQHTNTSRETVTRPSCRKVALELTECALCARMLFQVCSDHNQKRRRMRKGWPCACVYGCIEKCIMMGRMRSAPRRRTQHKENALNMYRVLHPRHSC